MTGAQLEDMNRALPPGSALTSTSMEASLAIILMKLTDLKRLKTFEMTCKSFCEILKILDML